VMTQSGLVGAEVVVTVAEVAVTPSEASKHAVNKIAKAFFIENSPLLCFILVVTIIIHLCFFVNHFKIFLVKTQKQHEYRTKNGTAETCDAVFSGLAVSAAFSGFSS
jgi:hypothetical protein